MKKICRDCRYVTGHTIGPLCNHPIALKAIDVVSGVEDRRTAREMRADVTLCGIEAQLFSEPESSRWSRLMIALGLRAAMSASQ